MAKDSTSESLDYQEIADRAINNKEVFDLLIETLSEGNRRERQKSARTIHVIALSSPQSLLEAADDIAEALNRPEAQTRWECMRALTLLVSEGYRPKKAAFEGICDALYDEISGIVREAAFTLLCTYGASSETNAKKSWPYLDEAIQCYHGNDEFNDMLTSLTTFAETNKSKEVAEALAKRMTFDAENAKGTLRMHSKQIVEVCNEKIKKRK